MLWLMLFSCAKMTINTGPVMPRTEVGPDPTEPPAYYAMDEEGWMFAWGEGLMTGYETECECGGILYASPPGFE